jgi:hypothetical protein
MKESVLLWPERTFGLFCLVKPMLVCHKGDVVYVQQRIRYVYTRQKLEGGVQCKY